ncbi:hypothetical protein ACLOJK_034806, partial [Asimina triloba]
VAAGIRLTGDVDELMLATTMEVVGAWTTDARRQWRWKAWIDGGVGLTSAAGVVVVGGQCAMVAVGIFVAGRWQANEAQRVQAMEAATSSGGSGRRWRSGSHQ